MRTESISDLTERMEADNPRSPLRIVIPGGSGQIGQMLAQSFQQRGHHVTVLTRSPFAANWLTVHWDGEQRGAWTETLEGADVCINLTGRSINCRHHLANRKAIYQSRMHSTRLLHEVIAELAHPPRLWMNASSAALYQRRLDADGVDLPLDEASSVAAGDLLDAAPWKNARGFLPRVTRDWEAAFFERETPRTRKIALRSAVTLSPAPGNAFAVLAHLVRMSLGGTQGNGRQFVSWMHEKDYARAVEFLIEHEEMVGPVNLAAPLPLPNREFMAILRDAFNVPNGIAAPSLVLYLGAFLMRTEAELLLNSCRVLPRRLLQSGFTFDFPDWPLAAEDLARQWRSRP